MKQTLLFLSLKSWRQHKLRISITIISVCIAVSVFFALQSVNQSLQQSLESTVDKLAGKATLQVTAGEAGIPEEVLDTVRSTAGVTNATGVVQIFCRTKPDFQRWRELLIFGIDPDGWTKLRPSGTGSSPLSAAGLMPFLRFPGIAISSTIAMERGISAGDILPVYAPQGRVDLPVLAVFDDGQIGNLHGGQIGVMEIHAAQTLFGLGRKLDRIDIITGPEFAVESVRQSLKASLANGLDVERPQQRAAEVEDAIGIV